MKSSIAKLVLFSLFISHLSYPAEAINLLFAFKKVLTAKTCGTKGSLTKRKKSCHKLYGKRSTFHFSHSRWGIVRSVQKWGEDPIKRIWLLTTSSGEKYLWSESIANVADIVTTLRLSHTEASSFCANIIPELGSFSLPSLNDYQVAMKNGLSIIFNDHKFSSWTSSYDTKNQSKHNYAFFTTMQQRAPEMGGESLSFRCVKKL